MYMYVLKFCHFSCSLKGALGVNLQMPGPIQRSVSDVQCSGQENELLSCVHGDVTNELPCESAAGIVCQGNYYIHRQSCNQNL